MAQPVDGGSPQDAVWKGIGPFRDIEIRSDDGAFAFIAFGDDIVEVFILAALQGLEAEVIDNEQAHRCELGKLSLKAVVGTGGIELRKHFGYGGKQNIVSGADGTVAQGLGDVTFAGAAGTNDEHTDLFLDKPAGSQIDDQAAIDIGVEAEVELFQGFLISEVGPSKSGFKALLRSSGDFIGDDGGQKVHIGELLVDGLAVAGLYRVHDTG